MTTRDRRVNLALKWHHLDNLDVGEIQDRFEREGIGSYAESTIRSYLNESPEKEEVLQAIEQEHANIRLQAAERYERLFQEAREDQELAVEDEPVLAMVPKMEVNQGDDELRVSDWERLEAGDDGRPEWATERDVVIRFTNDARHIQPGEKYPAGAERGQTPEYRKAVVGLKRDQPDRVGRSFARQEAAGHLHEKAEVLGAYEEDINLSVSGEVDHDHDHEHSLDEDTKEIIDDLADDLKA